MTDYPEKGGTPCIGNYTEYSPTGFSFLGGGGTPNFNCRDDRIGAKIKTQKNPWTKI